MEHYPYLILCEDVGANLCVRPFLIKKKFNRLIRTGQTHRSAPTKTLKG